MKTLMGRGKNCNIIIFIPISAQKRWQIFLSRQRSKNNLIQIPAIGYSMSSISWRAKCLLDVGSSALMSTEHKSKKTNEWKWAGPSKEKRATASLVDRKGPICRLKSIWQSCTCHLLFQNWGGGETTGLETIHKHKEATLSWTQSFTPKDKKSLQSALCCYTSSTI